MHIITFENVQIAVKGVEPRNTGQKNGLFGLDDRWMSCRFFQSRLDMWLACWILMLHSQRFPHIKHGLPTCDVFFFYCLMENAHRVLRSLERRQSLVGNAPHHLCIMLKKKRKKRFWSWDFCDEIFIWWCLTCWGWEQKLHTQMKQMHRSFQLINN